MSGSFSKVGDDSKRTRVPEKSEKCASFSFYAIAILSFVSVDSSVRASYKGGPRLDAVPKRRKQPTSYLYEERKVAVV